MKIILNIKIAFIVICSLALIGCGNNIKIKHGPYCMSNAASQCHDTGINFGTEEMQSCINNIKIRCKQTPEQPTPKTEFQKCMASVNSSSLSCTLRCMGSPSNNGCHQVCDDRRIAQTDRCEAKQKGTPYNYNPPVQSQPGATSRQRSGFSCFLVSSRAAGNMKTCNYNCAGKAHFFSIAPHNMCPQSTRLEN